MTLFKHPLSYLAELNAITILVAAQKGTIGPVETSSDASYLADTLILLRFFESQGSLKKAVSVVKHRKSSHEDTIREMQITAGGIRIGEVLTAFRGVLTGVPEYLGKLEDLMNPRKQE
jgi:circadian clock protein KaiC